MLAIEIRNAGLADLPAILDIYNEAILSTTATAEVEPVTLESRRKWFEDRSGNGYPVLVAEVHGVIAGFACLSTFVPRHGYRFTAENMVYVNSASQGFGVGYKLLSALVDEARVNGLRNIVARIADENPASSVIHSKLGFEKVGEFKGLVFKFDRWIDVAFWQLRIE